MIGHVFRNRDEAGSRLADALADRVSGPVTVLAIPRGGVAVAAPVANALGAPLDVVIPRKLGAPDNPELAIGAVAPGVMVLHEPLGESADQPELSDVGEGGVGGDAHDAIQPQGWRRVPAGHAAR